MPKEARSKEKTVHPLSRRAGQMSRQKYHDNKIDKRHKEKGMKVEALGERLKWFKDNLSDDRTAYSKIEASQLITRYMNRFQDETDQMQIVNGLKGRSGLQFASRQQAIKVNLEADRMEFETNGFEIPDIINGTHLREFRKWNGEMRFVPNLKMRKVKRADTESGCDSSTLPPLEDDSTHETDEACEDIASGTSSPSPSNSPT